MTEAQPNSGTCGLYNLAVASCALVGAVLVFVMV